MLTVRSMSMLRIWVLARQSSRVLSSCIVLPSSDVHRPVPQRCQQISWFSSSTVAHARRSNKDPVDVNASEEYTNEEKETDDGDEDGAVDQNEQEKIRKHLEQYNLPKGYRLIIKHLASLRLDLICSAGTGIGRSAVEDEFYGSKLRVNGEKSSKKAQQVKEGDLIDLIMSRTDGAKYKSKRIIVYKVFDDKSLKNKVRVCLIAWRQGIDVDGSTWS